MGPLQFIPQFTAASPTRQPAVVPERVYPGIKAVWRNSPPWRSVGNWPNAFSASFVLDGLFQEGS